MSGPRSSQPAHGPARPRPTGPQASAWPAPGPAHRPRPAKKKKGKPGRAQQAAAHHPATPAPAPPGPLPTGLQAATSPRTRPQGRAQRPQPAGRSLPHAPGCAQPPGASLPPAPGTRAHAPTCAAMPRSTQLAGKTFISHNFWFIAPFAFPFSPI